MTHTVSEFMATAQGSYLNGGSVARASNARIREIPR